MKDLIAKIKKTVKSVIVRDKRDWKDVNIGLSAKSILLSAAWNAGLENGLCEKEFKCYSQFGDDGIIQYLIRRIPIVKKSFIEFGVGDYFESNTHFLLINDNWSGFVMDGSRENIKSIQNSEVYWQHDLVAACAFIDRDNIDDLICSAGFKDIGLLHIDLDGNDYWILEQIDTSEYCIDILILEYNAVFGNDRKVTVPYHPKFDRREAHYSCLYWGASLPALAELAEKKGFFFVGTNSAGNNAYFINKRHSNYLQPVSLSKGFTDSMFRESRAEDFTLSYLRGDDRREMILGLPVWDISKNAIVPFE